MKNLFCYSSLLLIFLIISSNVKADLIGNAYDIKSNQLVYTEQYTTTYNGQRKTMRTIYSDVQGQIIGDRTVTYNNDQVIHYQLQQDVIAYRESIRRDIDSINFSASQGSQKEPDTKTISNAKDVIIDAEFSDIIIRNWEKLIAGDPLNFQFASANKMKIFNLEVKLADQQDGIAMFTMTAANPLIRLLLSPISIGYSNDIKQLAYYKGVSNIQNPDGDYYDVEIFYE